MYTIDKNLNALVVEIEITEKGETATVTEFVPSNSKDNKVIKFIRHEFRDQYEDLYPDADKIKVTVKPLFCHTTMHVIETDILASEEWHDRTRKNDEVNE